MKTEFGDLEQIPGIGKKMAEKLVQLGYHRIADLKKANPEEMYLRYSALVGGPVDRCVLYIWRIAVDYAQHPEKAAKKQWWDYKY